MARKTEIPRGLKNQLTQIWLLEDQVWQLEHEEQTAEIKKRILDIKTDITMISSVVDMKFKLFTDMYYEAGDKRRSDVHGPFVDVSTEQLISILKESMPNLLDIKEYNQRIIQDDQPQIITVLDCSVRADRGTAYVYSLQIPQKQTIPIDFVLRQAFVQSQVDSSYMASEFYTQVFDVLWDYNSEKVVDMIGKKIEYLSQFTQPINPMDKQIVYVEKTLKALLDAREQEGANNYIGAKFVDDNSDTLKSLYNNIKTFSANRIGLAQNPDVEMTPALNEYREDCDYRLNKLIKLKEVLFREADNNTDNDAPKL